MRGSRIRLLQGMPVFGALSSDTLEFVLERSTEVSVPARQYFFHELSEADGFFVLQSGSVVVQRRRSGIEVRLKELQVGDCFGEMAIVECRNRNASVRALEDSVALEIPLSALHDLYEHDLEQFTLIQMNLARELSRRLSDAAEEIFEAKMAAREHGGSYQWYLS